MCVCDTVTQPAIKAEDSSCLAYEGIRIISHSTICCIPFLASRLIPYVLVTVGVATKVSGTAAVVGVIEDAGKTPMSKMEYNCFTSSGHLIITFQM